MRASYPGQLALRMLYDFDNKLGKFASTPRSDAEMEGTIALAGSVLGALERRGLIRHRAPRCRRCRGEWRITPAGRRVVRDEHEHERDRAAEEWS